MKDTMRKDSSSSIDGFVPRRGPALGRPRTQELGRPVFEKRADIGRASRPITQQSPEQSVSLSNNRLAVRRSEIDDSLAKIEDEETAAPKKRRGILGRKKQDKQPSGRRKKVIKRIFILILLIGLGIGAFMAYKVLWAGGSVFQGNLLGVLQNQPLKMDANGRTNVVVFGTSEDDPDHGGALLTDSIMLISADQKNHNAYLLSIPRDLWVDYNQACNSGYSGRINEVYSCFSDDGNNEDDGSKALMDKVGEITGLETQYYVHMNYSVLRDSVDAVGGVSVDIDSDDPRGIYDDNFDWMCKYKCNYVKYPNGPTGNMDGVHALALARARGASGNTYGLAQANFDREKYQRKILIALKEKAVSAGTLTNIGKVTGLIDAMGNNLRTNFDTAEIRTLMSLGSDTPSEAIKSLVLNDPEMPLVRGASVNGASVLIPTAGEGNFNEIQSYVAKNTSSDPVIREAANIVVMNGTETIGLGQTEADKLTDDNFTVSSVTNAPTSDYAKTTVYRINKKGMGGTAKVLAKRYGVKVKTTEPPFAVDEGVDFVVIVGASSTTSSKE